MDPKQPDWGERLATSVAGRVRQARQDRRISAQQLADRCAELGYPIRRSVIANFESGRRTALGFAELLVFAAALEVAPSTLVFPLDRDDEMELLPGLEAPAWKAARWFTGHGPFPGDDPESPPSDLCTGRAAQGMRIGTLPLGCLRCGHTMLLHPGAHNPALEHCLVCELATATTMEET